MPEITSCPSCQRKLQVPESLIGQDVQCPTCNATFVAAVDGGGAAPPPPPPPPSPYTAQPPADRPAPPPPPPSYQPRESAYDRGPSYSRTRRDFAPHRGGMILAFGIIGIIVCVIFAPIAWIMGNGDMQEIRAGRMDPEGEGLTQAGRILGMIGTILVLVVLAIYCLIFLVVFGAAAAGAK